MTGVMVQESLSVFTSISPMSPKTNSTIKRHYFSELPFQTTFQDLDEDIVTKIFEMANLSFKDKCRLSCVSKLWKKILYSPPFWKTLVIEGEKMCIGVGLVPSRCSELNKIVINDPNSDLHTYNSIISACNQSLKSISINCDKNDIVGNEASISSILWILSLYCRNIESVSLISDGREGVLGHLENKTMWFLTTGFRNVKHFTSMCHDSITKQCIFLIVIAWRDLSSLRIHCGSLAVEDIMPLSKCHKLCTLELIGCKSDFISSIPSHKVLHDEVRDLTLTNMICTKDDVLMLCKAFPALKQIRLQKWTNVEEPLNDFKARLKGLIKLKSKLERVGFSLKFD